MRELLSKSRINDHDYITKSTVILENNDSVKSLDIGTNLESIMKSCRLMIMTDSSKNKPRKIILDTKLDNYKISLPGNKEAGRLFEIVFGNFCLSSKADGFKLHIIKNPAEVIVSKLFNVPYNSMFYDNRNMYRKVSPDSGHNQSLSSNSSINSMCSSNLSPSSSVFQHPLSVNSIDSVTSNLSLPRSTSRNRALNGGQNSSNSSLINSGIKNSNSNFFNENYDMCTYRSSLMMSAVLIFVLPDENKAEFEEFIFQYYAMLESVLNRLARLILDDCHSLYNGTVIDCWKQSKRWIVSLLPRPASVLSPSCSTRSNLQISNTAVNTYINVPMFEYVVDYFTKEKRLSFLADVISAVIRLNPNASSKYLKNQSDSSDSFFPYLYLLQNLGMDIPNEKFNRIIVKGLSKTTKVTSSSSWKNRLSTSLNHYKKMWNNQSESSVSCTDIDTYSQRTAFMTESITRTMSDTLVSQNKEVQMVTAFIADLIRPVSKVAYRPHILPSEVPVLSDCRKVTIGDNRSAIEVPLLEDGLLLDQEMLPDHSELFMPTITTDEIVRSLTPLQGYVYNSTDNDLVSQLSLESRHSTIIHNDTTFYPQFLVVDVDQSSVAVQSHSVTQSPWIKDMLNTFAGLIKVDGYDSVIGQLYLHAAFENLAQKRLSINRSYCMSRSDEDNARLLSLHGLKEADLSLILRDGSL